MSSDRGVIAEMPKGHREEEIKLIFALCTLWFSLTLQYQRKNCHVLQILRKLNKVGFSIGHNSYLDNLNIFMFILYQ